MSVGRGEGHRETARSSTEGFLPGAERTSSHLLGAGCLGHVVVLSDSFMKVPGRGEMWNQPSGCVPQQSISPMRQKKLLFFSRRFLNKSSEDDAASESFLPSEGASSDPVTLRRRMLAAAAERRLQKQQTS